MALDLKKTQEIIEQPTKGSEISEADRLQKRLKFYTETHFSALDGDINGPYQEFMDWVKGILVASDKYKLFSHLMTLPLASLSLVRKIYRDLSRVFDSRNSSSTYQFTSSELQSDWLDYKERFLHTSVVWRKVGWKKMKTSPCSVLVVDMPISQSSKKPEPYFYWLEITDVIDYKLKEGSSVEFDWIVFKQPDHKVAAFDESHIVIYRVNDENKIVETLADAPHDLGYCPARFFWSTQISDSKPTLKENPITQELSNIAWYLFFLVSKRHLDLYGAYPIMSGYESGCDYEDDKGHHCNRGLMVDEDGSYVMGYDGNVLECPVCSRKKLNGPGSYVVVPTPSLEDGIPDMRDPISILSVDRNALDYNVGEEDRLERKIRTAVVGEGGEISDKEAVNVDQISANFESRTNVLLALKTNFEEAQKFVEETVCRLRYGRNFIGMSLSWGTEFYIYTVTELRRIYEIAKKAGASSTELTAIDDLILETQFKNNPLLYERIKLLRQIEPYANKTEQEVVVMWDKGLIDKTDFMLKLNFQSLIDRFERENTDILEFGRNIALDKKIEIITKKLKEYVAEQETNTPTIGGGENNQGGSQGRANGAQGAE